MTKNKIRTLTECALMLALATALSFIAFEMPFGGSITPCSMLPIMFIAIKYGAKQGFSTAFLYSLIQLAQALLKGNVFAYTETATVVIICVVFDYLIPFTALGLVAFFRKGKGMPYAGIVVAVVIRFLCHFFSGVTIWKQWAWEGYSPALYSFLYNGGFLLPELIICLVGAAVLLEVPKIRQLIGLPDNEKNTKPLDKKSGSDYTDTISR